MIASILWLQSKVNILSFQMYKAGSLDWKLNTEEEEEDESLYFNV